MALCPTHFICNFRNEILKTLLLKILAVCNINSNSSYSNSNNYRVLNNCNNLNNNNSNKKMQILLITKRMVS